MGAFVYMLRCRDGAFYIGVTGREELASRIEEHNAGLDPRAFTFPRRPVELVWADHFERIDEAIATERRLKGWSRAKKIALIDGDWDRLRGLAKRRGGSNVTSP